MNLKHTGLNIGAAEIAAQTHKLANVWMYQVTLEALQVEAARIGYCFTTGSETAILPDAAKGILGRALVRARRKHVDPLLDSEKLELFLHDDEATGYTCAWLETVLKALEAQGVCLKAGPDAEDLLKAHVEEQRKLREGEAPKPPPEAFGTETEDGVPLGSELGLEPWPEVVLGPLSKGAQRFEHYQDSESLERYVQRTAAPPLRNLLRSGTATWPLTHALLKKYGLTIQKGDLGGYVVGAIGTDLKVKASRVFLETFAGKAARAETQRCLGEWVPAAPE